MTFIFNLLQFKHCIITHVRQLIHSFNAIYASQHPPNLQVQQYWNPFSQLDLDLFVYTWKTISSFLFCLFRLNKLIRKQTLERGQKIPKQHKELTTPTKMTKAEARKYQLLFLFLFFLKIKHQPLLKINEDKICIKTRHGTQQLNFK